MSKITNSQENTVVNDALRIAIVLNKHLNEIRCEHTLREIATEIFEKKGPGFTRPQNQTTQPATIPCMSQNDSQEEQ